MGVGSVRRTFVDIEHGQILCRIVGNPSVAKTPLLMLHGGPGSSAGLVPMIEALAADGMCVIAPDMMGNGLSDPPPSEPDIGFYVDCVSMVLDRLGVRHVDCYGHHAGAQIGCALAIRSAGSVRKLVLDGVALFSKDQRREFLDRYAPPVEPGPSGDHLERIWRFLSATTLRFPHYSEYDRDRIPGGVALAPSILTDQFADVVCNWRTWHLSYRASFGEDFAQVLPLVRQPTMVLEVSGDPLAVYAQSAAALISGARVTQLDRARRTKAIMQFLYAGST